MNLLSAFGLAAVTLMLLFYALERRRPMVRLGIRWCLRTGFCLWFSPRSLAIRSRGGRLVSGRGQALVGSSRIHPLSSAPEIFPAAAVAV